VTAPVIDASDSELPSIRADLAAWRRLDQWLKWLYPGMHVKRWLALLVFGVMLMGLGLAYLLREAYLSYTFPGVFYYLTLQFIPRYWRGAIFIAVAAGSFGLGLYKLSAALLAPFTENGRINGSLVDELHRHRFKGNGPRIVAIGGGTGLSILLRGLKDCSSNLTAVVTVADDGGSSGRLRRDFGVLPPGDVRNCIAALADTEPLMRSLFQYRFPEGSDLEGHSFGNLFIVAMCEVTGSFEEAIRTTSRVLATRGQILPSTLADVTLIALTEDGERIRGESTIGHLNRRIREVFIEPPDAAPHPDAVRAILDADLIVLGPGSLYTSVLPNLLVRGIVDAIRASDAVKIYVSNVATQHGETDSFTVSDHIHALESHVGRGVIEHVIANSNLSPDLPSAWHSEPVRVSSNGHRDPRIVEMDVISEENRYRHDPAKLAAAIMRLYHSRGQRATVSRAERADALTV
jgi:uncharacterized cofD-like protein